MLHTMLTPETTPLTTTIEPGVAPLGTADFGVKPQGSFTVVTLKVTNIGADRWPGNTAGPTAPRTTKPRSGHSVRPACAHPRPASPPPNRQVGGFLPPAHHLDFRTFPGPEYRITESENEKGDSAP